MYFKDVIGQESLKERLRQSAARGIVPHAQLFYEPGGAGAFPLAMAYARYLNCTNRTGTDACGHCPSCVKYDEYAHPDLHFIFPIVAKKEKKKEVCDDFLPEWRNFLKGHIYFGLNDWLDEMDAENKQALIYSDESKQILKKVSLRIYEAEYRIFFVWLPERMHPTCANKLLKLVEEPPAKTVILMVSEAPDKVLGTILSRTQQIQVTPIPQADLAAAMAEQYHIDREQADNVAHMACGNYLKAVEAISVGEDNQYFLEAFMTIMRNSWARNVRGMKQLAEELASIGREKQKNFLAYCQHMIRENFLYRFQAPELTYMTVDEKNFSKNFAPYVNERNVIDLMEELEKAEYHIGQNVNAKMVFFDLALSITVLIKK